MHRESPGGERAIAPAFGAPDEASAAHVAAPAKRTLDHAPAQLTGPNDGVGVVHEPVVHVRDSGDQ